MRQAPTRDYLHIKAMFRDLVTRAGGPKRAAEITRGQMGHISESGAAHCPDRFPAIDQVYDLEIEVSDPVLTRALADLHGMDLVHRDGAKPMGIHAHFARIVMETRDVEIAVAGAMADGRLEDAETATIIAEGQQAIEAIQKMVAELRGPRTRMVK